MTLKNVPEKLHRKLKARASQHRRSLNREVIACLEEVTRAKEPDLREWLERVRKRRSRTKVFLKEAQIERAIQKGRR